MQEERRANRRRNNNLAAAAVGANVQGDNRVTSPSQRAFWQAITVGELEAMQVLLVHRRHEIDINKMDEMGEQRQGCTALHLAILEMPTWKTEGRSEGRNGIQTADFVKKFFNVLLENGADIERPCNYTGEWYLQTAAGKTKSFFPDGYNALGLVLQFVEITRGAEVISTNVTKRLELIRDLLFERMRYAERLSTREDCPSLGEDMSRIYAAGEFTDVQLISDNEVIHAHRLVLAARSPVFCAMLRSDRFEEGRSGRVQVEQSDPVSLRMFVKFLYEDSLNDEVLSGDFQVCHNLIMLSNRYDVNSLKLKCSEMIARYHLSEEKAATILKISDQNCVDHLREVTLRFISKPEHVNNVMSTREFKNLDSDLVQKVLKRVVSGPESASNLAAKSSPINSAKRRRMTNVEMHYSDDEEVHAPPNGAEVDDEEEA